MGTLARMNHQVVQLAFCLWIQLEVLLGSDGSDGKEAGEEWSETLIKQQLIHKYM